MPRILAALILAALLDPLAAGAAQPALADAIEEHRRLAAESPTAEVLNDLANLLVLARSPEEAEAVYRRVVGLDPGDVRSRFNLGLLLQSRLELDEALALFTEVVEHRPDHAWAHYQIGRIHEDRSDRAQAIGAYAQAFALDPELYFADVNPQVVANELLTESLLEAARLRFNPSSAPMEFARPREITEMLLNLPSVAPQVEPDDPEDEGGTEP